MCKTCYSIKDWSLSITIRYVPTAHPVPVCTLKLPLDQGCSSKVKVCFLIKTLQPVNKKIGKLIKIINLCLGHNT